MYKLIKDMKKFNCSYETSELVCSCDSGLTTLPKIYFTIGNSAVIEASKDMLFDRVNGVCYMNILPI